MGLEDAGPLRAAHSEAEHNLTPARPEHAWFASTAPHHAALSARAALDTDATSVTLDGAWSFRRWPRVPAGTGSGFEARAYDDSGWGRIAVPHSWEQHGAVGDPKGAHGAYSFPIDPPDVPDENTTGEYRRWVDLSPAAGPGRWLLRCEGVDSAYEAYVNGTRVGHAMGSALTHEFDVTDQITAGRNLVAVRVHEWSAGSYLECSTAGVRPGIVGRVRLMHRPEGGIDDLFVHADYDAATRTGRLGVEGPPGAVVRLPELGLELHANEAATVAGVEPWSAEVPRLYEATVTAGGPDAAETVRISCGFRTIEIRDATLLANGAPLRVRGVDWTPAADTARADIELMKRHNVNAVRMGQCFDTRVLDLCDEYGLWVIEDFALDTRGFEVVEWRRHPEADPAWRDALLDRARRTLERDKNHPCVIGWSLGNEARQGANLDAMAEWVRARDPDRFILSLGDSDCGSADVYASSDAGPAQTELVGRGEEPPAADRAMDGRRRALPFLLCQGSAQAAFGGLAGPGEYVELFEEYPRLAGGFTGEWARVLASDRTPLPGLAEIARAYAPLVIQPDADGVTVTSRYSHRTTAHLRFMFRIEDDGEPVAAGVLDVPELGPGESRRVPLPESAMPVPASPSAGAQRWLTVSAELASGTPWAPTGQEVAWGQSRYAERGAITCDDHRRRPARPPGEAPAVARPDGGWGLGAARFDPAGRLVGVGALTVLGPCLDLWRAPTDRDERGPAGPIAAVWRELGLDRLRHRTVAVTAEDNALSVVAHVMPDGTDTGYEVEYRWRADDGGLRLDVVGSPLGAWTVPVPRLGVRMAVPRELDTVRWVGRGPGQAYPGAALAARQGRFSAPVLGLQAAYPRPQENGARRDVRWAELSGSGCRLLVEGEGFILTVRPWTAEVLDAAAVGGELVADPDWMWVNLDDEHEAEARRFRLSLALHVDADAH